MLLPAVIDGKKVKVLTYVIGGSFPILFGRPVLEKLGLAIDYANNKMKWPSMDWEMIPRGEKGEHLVTLVEDMPRMLSSEEFVQILAPTDFEKHVNVGQNLGYQALFGDDVLVAEADMDNAQEGPQSKMEEQRLELEQGTKDDAKCVPSATTHRNVQQKRWMKLMPRLLKQLTSVAWRATSRRARCTT